MSTYLTRRPLQPALRLPLEAKLDLTYRCNNNCRHCWLYESPDSSVRTRELTADQITDIAGQARKLGCRQWIISGGEPMLRPDFEEIFDCLTRNAVSYTLNTNGTLITPKAAGLLKRKGAKLIALYGATADVHDHITRNPGSFEATLRGMSYLNEAGAGFTVQIVPMRDNYHQYQEMVQLAERYSPAWRIGASWLNLSAVGRTERNEEIACQRLSPQEVVALDGPSLDGEDHHAASYIGTGTSGDGDCIFAQCISHRQDFHIDPYGQMSFCGYIKDPGLRYDLRNGTVADCWERFIPSIAESVRGDSEYLENCGTCTLRQICRWCPAHGYLEHRRYTAKIDYLCEIAREKERYMAEWQQNHRRYYKIGGITIQVESDIAFTDTTYHPMFKSFEADGPGDDMVYFYHHFTLPDMQAAVEGKKVYCKVPWSIRKVGDGWQYRVFSEDDSQPNIVAAVDGPHSRVRIYHDGDRVFRQGGLDSLTAFSSDQVILTHALVNWQACVVHSSGVAMDGKGIMFVGHSEAGKSTTVTMLRDHAEILCDERNIIRRHPEGFRLYGTWSHGTVSDVSGGSAPLRAICFLHKADENRLEPVEDRRHSALRLIACLSKPLETVDWWEKVMALVDQIVQEVPCYNLYLDKSGQVVDVLKQI